MDEELRRRHEEAARKVAERRQQMQREGKSVIDRSRLNDVVIPGHISPLMPASRPQPIDYAAALERLTKLNPEEEAAENARRAAEKERAEQKAKAEARKQREDLIEKL